MRFLPPCPSLKCNDSTSSSPVPNGPNFVIRLLSEDGKLPYQQRAGYVLL
jgi:hypothetical protein